MMDVFSLLKTLIAFPSQTPNDAGCQTYIADILSRWGFVTQFFQYGEVTTLWAKRGHTSPHVCFLGHTDVVPPGPLTAWSRDPFDAWMDDTFIYGRGAVDMKGGIAAFLTALSACLSALPEEGSVSILLTSDEEGPADDGIRRVAPALLSAGEHMDYVLVGEPVCLTSFGDTLKHGARGSQNGTLVVRGKQGHIAYDYCSPIALALPFLQACLAHHWDDGGDGFPPTVFQISNIHAGTGATNIVPGELHVRFNFRYAPVSTPASLQEAYMHLLSVHGIHDFECHWDRPNLPYYAKPGPLLAVLSEAIHRHTGVSPHATVGGATSDARFLGALATEIVECGPCCTAAHQVNECIAKADLLALTQVYESMLRRLLIEREDVLC